MQRSNSQFDLSANYTVTAKPLTSTFLLVFCHLFITRVIMQMSFSLTRVYQAAGNTFLSDQDPAEAEEVQIDLSLLSSVDDLPVRFPSFPVNFYEHSGRVVFDAAAADFLN